MAKLIINPTSSNRREVPLSRSSILTIGRDPSNDLVLPDAMVSRRHAVIEHRGSQFFLRDCNSANGSVVNGDRVSERGLRDGDLVAIGSMRLLFREEPAVSGAKVVPHPSVPRLHCPSCGNEYRRGDLFCRECGTQVSQPSGPARAVCASCGTAVHLPARFCSACGASLAAQGQPLEPPEEPVAGRGEAEAVRAETPPAAAEPAAPSPRREAEPAPAERVTEERPAHAAGATAPALRPEAAPPRPSADPSPAAPPAARADRPPPPRDRRPERPREAARARPSAGFGSRIAAGLVDAVFVLSGQAIMVAPVYYYWWSREVPGGPADVSFLPIVLSVALGALAALLGLLYHVYFWGVRGATPGKELLGLRVEAEDGTWPISLGRAALRAFGYLLSVASLGIGFLVIAVSGEGLHDRVAGTRVVRGPRP